MAGLILFGGTFDPVHSGHLLIARDAMRLLHAEKVVFIPAKNPRWKEPISSADRLAMLEAALADQPDFAISHFEIDSPDLVNYTVDTARHFVRRYPEHRLYFLIGFDQVDNLDRWHEIEELAGLVQLVAVARPGYPRNHQLLKKYGVQVLECPEYPVSSTAIRELKSLRTPRPVIEYIVEHELYFAKSVMAYMSPRRYRHSVSTAWLAYDIAEANGLDPTVAFIAGYLHDIAREMEPLEARRLMELYYPEYLDYPPVFYHQFIGEYLAGSYFKISDERVLEAIRIHTSGDRAMGKYAKILFAADKIEPGRSYDSSELIAAVKKNLASGFKEVLRHTKLYYAEKGLPAETALQQRCFDYYIKGEEKSD